MGSCEGNPAGLTGIYRHIKPQDASMSVIFGDGMGRDGCRYTLVGYVWTDPIAIPYADKLSSFGFDRVQ